MRAFLEVLNDASRSARGEKKPDDDCNDDQHWAEEEAHGLEPDFMACYLHTKNRAIEAPIGHQPE